MTSRSMEQLRNLANQYRGLLTPAALAQARVASGPAVQAGVSQATHVSPTELGTLTPSPARAAGQEGTSEQAKEISIKAQEGIKKLKAGMAVGKSSGAGQPDRSTNAIPSPTPTPKVPEKGRGR